MKRKHPSASPAATIAPLTRTLACVAAAVLCGCGGPFFSRNGGGDEVTISVSPDVTAFLSEAGIQPERWTLTLVSSSGKGAAKTSGDGVFSVTLDKDEIAAFFLTPEISSPPDIPRQALPEIGAVYPFHCELAGNSIRASVEMRADFFTGYAASMIRKIISGSGDGNAEAENAARMIRAFNWTKFDEQLRGRKKPVPYPLFLDAQCFLDAFYSRATNMYWKVKSRETHSVSVEIPSRTRGAMHGSGFRIIMPYAYPDHTVAAFPPEPVTDGGGASTTRVESVSISVSLPDGHWVFLAAADAATEWFAVQITGGTVETVYTDDSVP